MSSSSTPTAYAVSPDSGEHWTVEGAWPVADGIFRIPLPLPLDGLKAVNVYVITTDEGLTLIDGGWAIPVAREVLDRSLRLIGAGFGDIRRFLVTHIHRDHYTMAAVLGQELGAQVAIGEPERPSLDMLHDAIGKGLDPPFDRALLTAGGPDLVEQWRAARTENDEIDLASWPYPDTWISGDTTFSVGARVLDAVHTPGHTVGHYVFADREEGVLFAGDHVLPTITPSIGFTMPGSPDPLGDFMGSLTKVRGLPDLRILPAHGPISPSSHTRVDELLSHHEQRLALCLKALGDRTLNGAEVARHLGWTRRETHYDDLDVFNKAMAAWETKVHLELLVARGLCVRQVAADGVVTFSAVPHGEQPS